MDIKIEDIKQFLEKKIRLVIDNKYTYIGEIVSIGTDYIRFKDKYDADHLFLYVNITDVGVVK